MSDLHEALGDLRAIRRQMAQTTQFRGCGPATLAGTGGAALLAGAAQSYWVSDPRSHAVAYVALWMATAAASSGTAAAQIYTRTRRVHSGVSDEMLRMSVLQFLPALGAGVLVTAVLVRCAPGTLWMLPGLWQVIYSLGVFASCRFLPRATALAAAWYLLTGLMCLALGDERALAPWTMSLAFGAGQMLLAAIVLRWDGEGDDEV